MAFRARISHPLGTELGRILRGMAADAEQALVRFPEDPHECIHALRAGMKKVRAVLELAAPELPSAQVSLAMAKVRMLKDHYANTRDEEILRRLFLSLAEEGEAGAVERLFAVREARPRHPPQRLLGCAREMRELFGEMPFWVATEEGSFGVLRRTARKARSRSARCRKKPSTENFHRWRKAIKRLWIQAGVLRPLDTGLRGVPGRANKLGEWLGKANDLANLLARIRAAEDGAVPPALEERIARRLDQIRRKALAKSKELHDRLDSSLAG